MSFPPSPEDFRDSALYMSGRCSGSNSTSKTGPMTWTTLPIFVAAMDSYLQSVFGLRPYSSAAAPPTISAISCVI